jgi:hypothetical protein
MLVWVGHSCPLPLKLISVFGPWVAVQWSGGSNMTMNCQKIGRVSAWFAVVLWLLLPALAHNGPPFPIIENQKVGPCVVSLWTHPDVGTGTFFVLVDPMPGSKIPDDLKIGIGVQPESGRLPEVVYAATRDDTRGQAEYKALADFDRDEFWRIRLIVRSSRGNGETLSRVEATPPGFGRWDLLLYLLPFLAVAFLWFQGITRTRNRRKRLQAA